MSSVWLSAEVAGFEVKTAQGKEDGCQVQRKIRTLWRDVKIKWQVT